MAVEVTISGLPDLRVALRAIPDKLKRRVLRNALAAGARLVRDDAKRRTPVLSGQAAAMAAPQRKPGTVRKAITVRTSKKARRAGNVGVFVNVRPAKGGNRGARNPNDPFYWRFLEFGWTPASGPRGNAGKRGRRQALRAGAPRKIPGFRFLQNSASKLGAALQVFTTRLQAALAKLNARQEP